MMTLVSTFSVGQASGLRGASSPAWADQGVDPRTWGSALLDHLRTAA